MRVLIILAVLLTISEQTFSQNSNFDKVDNYVDRLKLDRNISVDNLVSVLTKSFTNPTLKARAIYYWIARNIRYDYEGNKTSYWDIYPSTQAMLTDTYKFRKGICSGYSHLFKYMLTKAKIECQVVNGYARGDLQTVIVEKSNHAWNVVKLDNEWHLFDVTWASDTVMMKVDNFWFKTPPDLFILSHYPENSSWTLLDKNVSLTDFKNSPIYARSLFDKSIVSKFSTKGYYETWNNIVFIDLNTSKEYVWLIKLYDLDKGDWFSPTDIENQAFEKGFIKLTIDRKGKFILQLDAGENLDKGFSIHKELIYVIVESK